MQTANKYVLVIRRGPEQGKAFRLDTALVSLGRYAGNTITIADEAVSRHHARLKQAGDGYSIEDLNSANGLYVNDSRVTEPRPLKSGDVIRLGETVEMVYEMLAEGQAAAPSIPAFDEKSGLPRPVSDTGGTVYMKAVSTVGRDEPAPRGGSRAWVWVAILIGVLVVGAVVYFAFIAGR